MKLRDLIKGTPAFRPLEQLAKAAPAVCDRMTAKGTPCRMKPLKGTTRCLSHTGKP